MSYKYSANRKGERPRQYIKNYEDFLHADGYASYEKHYGDKIKEFVCMAHVRRNFFDFHKAMSSPIARDALKRIAELYEMEKHTRGKLLDERARIREAYAREKFEALFDWLQSTLPSVYGCGELTKAMRYAVTCMNRMKIYLADGRFELVKNITE